MANNIVVNFTSTIAAIDPLAAGIVCSEFGGNPVPLVSNAGGWHDKMVALAPGVIRASLAYYGGNPGYGAGGSSRTPGSGTALLTAIKSTGAIPLISYNGDTSDNGINASDAGNLVHYYNDNGGQHGGPIRYISIGNEPDNGGGTAAYESIAPGIASAMHAADPTINIGAPAAAFWDTGLISWAPANVPNLGNLSFHEYDGANTDGSGFPADSNYAPHCVSAKGFFAGMFGIEEANWDPVGGTTPNDYRNVCFIADIAGIILSHGGHLNVYGDSNGSLGILSDGSAGALGTPMAAYYGLGIHTGMNGQFKRWGANAVSCSTTFSGSTLTAFAYDSNKLVVVNKSTSAQALTIGVTLPNGATAGTFNVWASSGTTGLSAISQPVAAAAFSGGVISWTIPAGTAASIDITPAGASPYDSQIVALAPAGYWKLADATGSATCADSSGNGNTGTPTAGVTLGETDFPIIHSTDTAAAFAQASLGAVNTALQQTYTAVTAEAWVNREGSTAGGFPRIIAQDVGNPNGFVFSLNGGALYAQCAPGGTTVTLTGPAVPTAGWHHAVMRYTGTELSLWLDGVKSAALSGLSGTLTANANKVSVVNPGNQATTVGVHVSLQMSATDTAPGQTLTWTASGLPAAVTINSGTGLISGIPTTAATYNPTVTATDTTGAHGSVSFSWPVSAAAGASLAWADGGVLAPTGSQASAAVTLSLAVSAGDLICLVVGCPGEWVTPAISDSAGNSWRLVHGPNMFTSLWACTSAVAAASLTITASGATGTWFLAADRFAAGGHPVVVQYHSGASYGFGINLATTAGASAGSGLFQTPAGALAYGGGYTPSGASVTFTPGTSNGVAATMNEQAGNAAGSGFSQFVASASAGANYLNFTASATVTIGTVSAAFVLLSAANYISSFSPPDAAPGGSVTITGAGFTGATAVTFGGVAAASYTVNSDTQITAVVPAGGLSGFLAVTAPAGTATSVLRFWVDAVIHTTTGTTQTPVDGGLYGWWLDEYNSSAAMTQTSDTTAANGNRNFKLTQQTAVVPFNGAPAGWPDIYVGNAFGTITTSNPLNIPVSSITGGGVLRAWLSGDYSQIDAGSTYDMSFDIFFTPGIGGNPGTSGSIEMMIWLTWDGQIAAGSGAMNRNVTVAGYTCDTNFSGAHTAVYLLKPMTDSVAGLDIGLFAADMVARGLIGSSWYLDYVAVGYEPYAGARGAMLTNFTLAPPSPAPG